jgi:hypothetical protein
VKLRTVLGVLLVASGCGGAGDPASPNPVPTATPATTTPGGTLQGTYVFRLEPAAGCPSPRSSLSFRVIAIPISGDRRPGVQIFQEGAALTQNDATKPLLEMEFLYSTPSLQGSIATLPDDAAPDQYVTSTEGVRVSIHGIGFATVTTVGGGVGEVEQGTLNADLAFSSGTCSSTAHRWSLRLQ